MWMRLKEWWLDSLPAATWWLTGLILLAVTAVIVSSTYARADLISQQVAKAQRNTTYTPAPSPSPQPFAILFGDTYFNGSDAFNGQPAITSDQTFGPLAAKSLGYQYVVLGYAGTGFQVSREVAPATPNYVDQIAGGSLNGFASPPEFVVVQGGLADVNVPVSPEESAVESVLKSVQARFPTTKILLIGPAQTTTPDSAHITDIEQSMAQAAANTGVPFVKMSQLISKVDLTSNLVEGRNYPTPAGQELLASALRSKLIELDVPDLEVKG